MTAPPRTTDPARELASFLERLDVLPQSDSADEARAILDQGRRFVRQKVLDGLGDGGPVIVGLGGGTNVGKSTIFNLAIGEWVACPSEVARGTRSPAIYAHQDAVRRLEDSPFLDGYERRLLDRPQELNAPVEGTPIAFFHAHRRPDLERVAIVDAPDLDSNHVRNHAVARDVLFCADILLYVTSNQKYRDEVCEEFLARAHRLGKTIFVVFNFAIDAAVADFKERVKTITGHELPDEDLVAIPFSRNTDLAAGPWRARLLSFLARAADDPEGFRRKARRGARLALPRELAPILDRTRREVEALARLRRDLERAAARRGREYSNRTRDAGIPEMDEVLALVMKEFRVPGVDDVYDAVFDTTRSILARVRTFLGGPDPRKLREARGHEERQRLRRHYNAFIDDVREVFDRSEHDLRRALWALLPEGGLDRLDDDGARELAREWRDSRREIIERSRDKILYDLRERKAVKAFILTAKVSLRAAGIATMIHFGPTIAFDAVGSAALDLGLRSILNRVFGNQYQKKAEEQVIAGLEERFTELLGRRLIAPVIARFPDTHSPEAFARLEAAVVAVRDDARAEEGGPP